MSFKTYKVTCKSCEGSDNLKITTENQVMYTNHTPIISARFRPDMQWGFECSCGNDSRLAIEEKDQIGILVQGAPLTLSKIAKSLAAKNELRFNMEVV